jgi:hypothetical protein
MCQCGIAQGWKQWVSACFPGKQLSAVRGRLHMPVNDDAHDDAPSIGTRKDGEATLCTGGKSLGRYPWLAHSSLLVCGCVLLLFDLFVLLPIPEYKILARGCQDTAVPRPQI